MPEGTTITFPSGAGADAVYVAPFEDELIPLPGEAIPVPGDPVVRTIAHQQPQADPAFCPIHHERWKVVPAGVSKKTGKPYDAFYACNTQGCDQRPPKGWRG